VSAVQGGRLPVSSSEKLTAESALEEELFLGLRQLDGIDVGRIEQKYGVRWLDGLIRWRQMDSCGVKEVSYVLRKRN